MDIEKMSFVMGTFLTHKNMDNPDHVLMQGDTRLSALVPHVIEVMARTSFSKFPKWTTIEFLSHSIKSKLCMMPGMEYFVIPMKPSDFAEFSDFMKNEILMPYQYFEDVDNIDEDLYAHIAASASSMQEMIKITMDSFVEKFNEKLLVQCGYMLDVGNFNFIVRNFNKGEIPTIGIEDLKTYIG